MWEHDKGGCNKRGNCGRPDCLPQWTRVSDTKLKDRIVEKIRIEIRGCLLQIELGQQTLPLSHLTKITPLLLPCMHPCLYTILGRIQYTFNMCILRSYTPESNSTPASQELDFHLLNLLQEHFRNVFFFFDSALRTALRLFDCADSGFWLRPEILSSIWDKSRPGDLSKNLSLLGVQAAWLSDTGSYDQEIQPRTVWSVVLLPWYTKVISQYHKETPCCSSGEMHSVVGKSLCSLWKMVSAWLQLQWAFDQHDFNIQHQQLMLHSWFMMHWVWALDGLFLSIEEAM